MNRIITKCWLNQCESRATHVSPQHLPCFTLKPCRARYSFLFGPKMQQSLPDLGRWAPQLSVHSTGMSARFVAVSLWPVFMGIVVISQCPARSREPQRGCTFALAGSVAAPSCAMCRTCWWMGWDGMGLTLHTFALPRFAPSRV